MKKKIFAMLIFAMLIFAMLIFAGVVFASIADEDEHAPAEKVVTEVPVRVGKITRATLHSAVTAYGSVEPEPASANNLPASARVASPGAGVVSDSHCYEGKPVKKGDLLFQLDSRAVNVAVQSAENNYTRQKKVLSLGGTSQKALQDAEQQLAAARAQQDLLKISAPLSGTIVQVDAKPGEAVDVNSVLAEIIDLDRLIISANVSSDEASSLKTNAAAKISSGSQPSNGKLIFIGASIDPKTGSVLTRISLPPDSGFRPGQFVELQIVSAEHKNVLAVPKESVSKNEEGKPVVAIVEGDKAIQKVIKTGLREGNLVEVEGEGLQEGMRIVTTGAYGLPAETKIRVLGD